MIIWERYNYLLISETVKYETTKRFVYQHRTLYTPNSIVLGRCVVNISHAALHTCHLCFVIHQLRLYQVPTNHSKTSFSSHVPTTCIYATVFWDCHHSSWLACDNPNIELTACKAKTTRSFVTPPSWATPLTCVWCILIDIAVDSQENSRRRMGGTQCEGHNRDCGSSTSGAAVDKQTSSILRACRLYIS